MYCYFFQAYYSLAKYADCQYQTIKDYMKSSTFENKQSVIKKAKVIDNFFVVLRKTQT